MESTQDIDRAAAHLDALPADGRQVYKLIRPMTVNGTEYTELHLDFDSLTSQDMEAIASALAMEGHVIPQVVEFSKPYLMHVAARAARINVNDLRKFSIKDGTQITMLAMNFLISAG